MLRASAAPPHSFFQTTAAYLMDSSNRPVGSSEVTASPGGPMSPCVSICTLDEQGICRGCLRSLAEISGWLQMSAAERRNVLGAIEVRRVARS